MSVVKFAWCGVVLLGATACGGDGATSSRPPTLSGYARAPVDLTETSFSDYDGLGAPTDLALVGDHLVVLDAMHDPAVHVFELSSGRRLGSTGPRGEGPGEFMGAWRLLRDPSDASSIWVYDLQLGRMTRLRLELLDGGGDVARRPAELVDSIIALESVAPESPVWISDSLMVSTGTFEGGRLGIVDRAGTIIGTAGAVPATDPAAPARLRQHAYQATLAKRPGGNRVVLGTRHAGSIEIFQVSGGGTRVERSAEGDVPFRFPPVFEIRQRGGGSVMALRPATRFGYVDVHGTPSRVFALFSGRTLGGHPSGEASAARYVHVLTWEGEFADVFRLESDVLSIVVDGEGRTLIAGRVHPSPALLRYELPEQGGTGDRRARPVRGTPSP